MVGWQPGCQVNSLSFATQFPRDVATIVLYCAPPISVPLCNPASQQLAYMAMGHGTHSGT